MLRFLKKWVSVHRDVKRSTTAGSVSLVQKEPIEDGKSKERAWEPVFRGSLLSACQQGVVETVKDLLDKGMSVDGALVACLPRLPRTWYLGGKETKNEQKDRQTACALLVLGSMADTITLEQALEALKLAAVAGYVQVVEMLFEIAEKRRVFSDPGSDFNLFNFNNPDVKEAYTTTDYASVKTYLDGKLLQQQPLFVAARNGRMDKLRELLLESRCACSTVGEGACSVADLDHAMNGLCLIGKTGDMEQVQCRRLRDQSSCSDVGAEEDTTSPLEYSLKGCSKPLDLDYALCGCTALMYACAAADVETVLLLLECGATANLLVHQSADSYRDPTSLAVPAASRVSCALFSALKCDKSGDKAAMTKIITALLACGADASVLHRGYHSILLGYPLQDKPAIPASLVIPLIRAGADITKCDVDANISPLMVGIVRASASSCTRLVQELLKAGANVNTINCRGETALYMAAKAGLKDVVAILLAAGARVNPCGGVKYGDVKTNYEPTALTEAYRFHFRFSSAETRAAYRWIFLKLIERRALFNERQCLRWLAAAVRDQDVKLLWLLSAHPSRAFLVRDCLRAGYCPLRLACKRRDLDVVEVLIGGIYTATQGLAAACLEECSSSFIDTLVERYGADPSAALVLVCSEECSLKAVQLVMRAGADASAQHSEALVLLLTGSLGPFNTGIPELLFEAGAEMEAVKDSNELIEASRARCLPKVQELLARGVNAATQHSKALIAACETSVSLWSLYARKLPDAKVAASSSSTSSIMLSSAAPLPQLNQESNEETLKVIRLLILHGAQVNSPLQSDVKAMKVEMDRAIARLDVAMVELLLGSGYQDVEGCSTLAKSLASTDSSEERKDRRKRLYQVIHEASCWQRRGYLVVMRARATADYARKTELLLPALKG